jgi:two-component system response regulator HydG
LDEVGNLSPEVQATLLSVIQERKFKKVGGNKEIQVDVRIIVASNEIFTGSLSQRKFREDYISSFNEFLHQSASTKKPKEDIPLFADFLFNKKLLKN